MTALWTRDEAVAATRGKAQGPDWLATGVSIDSRTVGKGDLFVALAGPNHDGHDHVAGALAAGAAAALVHKIPEGRRSGRAAAAGRGYAGRLAPPGCRLPGPHRCQDRRRHRQRRQGPAPRRC